MKIYIASKVTHAKIWRMFRDSKKANFISTWLNDAEKRGLPDFIDLWNRSLNEIKECDAFILYYQHNEELNGALVELGAALANNKKIFYIGPPNKYTMLHHPLITHCRTIDEAIDKANKLTVKV